MSEKKEYIERGAVLSEAQTDYVGEAEYCGMKDFVLVKDINAIPAADVVKVVPKKERKCQHENI